MVSVSTCGWCKHFRGLEDGWKSTCDAFPEGIPCNFNAEEQKECADSIYFSVIEDLSSQYNNIFHKQ